MNEYDLTLPVFLHFILAEIEITTVPSAEADSVAFLGLASYDYCPLALERPAPGL